MDGGERRQSQYGGPYSSSGPGRAVSGQSMRTPSQEQYSQAAPSSSRTDMTTQPAARPYMPDYHYSYQQPQYQPQLHYPSPFIQDPPRAHNLQASPNQQQYAAYSHGSMLPPAVPPPMYDSMPQYQQQRQSAAIEVMASQFGGGTMSQYLQPGDPSSAAGAGQQPYLSSQPEQQPYASMSFARPQLQPPFAPSSSEYSMMEQSVPQQSQEDASTRQATEEGRRQYEQQLRATFDAINAGRVTEASEKLVGVTEWLLGSVRVLGLHHDDEDNHEQRLSLWRELNHAWEALGQKQKSITESVLRARQQPHDLLSSSAIQTLIDKLIQLCDQVEKYGLVDYEMGIWEEQIVDIFIQCLNLLPHDQAHTDRGSNDR